MPQVATSSLYDEVVTITRYYFGPAARRFVDRQITNHLGIKPDKLAKRDLAKLTDWMCLAVALLAEDRSLINNYSADLKKLAAK